MVLVSHDFRLISQVRVFFFVLPFYLRGFGQGRGPHPHYPTPCRSPTRFGRSTTARSPSGRGRSPSTSSTSRRRTLRSRAARRRWWSVEEGRGEGCGGGRGCFWARARAPPPPRGARVPGFRVPHLPCNTPPTTSGAERGDEGWGRGGASLTRGPLCAAAPSQAAAPPTSPQNHELSLSVTPAFLHRAARSSASNSASFSSAPTAPAPSRSQHVSICAVTQ